jgi:hypothetical protein
MPLFQHRFADKTNPPMSDSPPVLGSGPVKEGERAFLLGQLS